MMQKRVHECECATCRVGDDQRAKIQHEHMNVLMSRLDEQQRRWYAAVESEKIGHGGDVRLSKITGLNVETIRRGRREMAQRLAERPDERIRVEGGGRLRVEKKVLK